jgi:hypothetical protein
MAKAKLKPATLTQHDFEALANQLQAKYDSGEKLTDIEIEFFCSAKRMTERVAFPFCHEYIFRDHYFRTLTYRPLPPGFELTPQQKNELDEMAQDWYTNVVLVPNHSNQTLLYVAKETRDEIKVMSRNFATKGVVAQDSVYQASLQKLLWMSRFIHFKVVYDFFLGYNPKEILIPSLFGDVLFNDYSLCHILFRHYAAGEKQYPPQQSFFTLDIQISSLHRIAALVLSWIRKANIVIAQPANRAISFKYKAEYYQLYLAHAVIQRKGHKENIPVLRVESLFPVNDADILQRISQLVPHTVSKDLTIFEQ